jgi:predicted MFS family arabinose efflux permease
MRRPSYNNGCHAQEVGVYARILREPGVAMIVLATVLGRLPIGISGLAILLYVQEVTGSFAAAGACAGALALGSALGAPLLGRLVDWRGERALLPLAFVHAAGLVLVWVLGAADAPTAALAASSLAAGTTLPPVSSVLRSRWPLLLAANPELIPSAFALDSVLIELIFVTGPLITTAIVATVGPEYALAVSAASVLAGTSMMLAGLHGRGRPDAPEAGSRRFGLGALAAPGLRTLVLASLPVGFALGTIEVVLPAFSAEEGSKELAGVLLAVWSGASGAAGLVYGARPARGPLEDIHLRFAFALPVACAVLFAATSPATMALLVVIAGLPIAPLIASRNQLVERVAPRGAATEAFTWPLTALVAGVSLGAAVGGTVVEEYSWPAAVSVSVAVSGAGALLLFARRGTLAPRAAPA